MTQLFWSARAAVAASCCALSVAALVACMPPEGQAQSPVAGGAQRSGTTAADRLPMPVVDVHELMHLFNEPLYRHLKSEMAQQPAEGQGWKSIKDRGLQAAEIANLVALRSVDPPQEQWLQASADLQSAGIALAKAAQTQDWQRTVEAYQGVIQRCNACHQSRAPGEAPTLQP